MQNKSTFLKTMCPGWIATFKTCMLFLSYRLRFSLLSLQITFLGLYICYVFSPLMFFFFLLRKKDGKAECLEKTLLPPSPYSQPFAHTQFSPALSAPFRRRWCVALILSAGCLPIQEGMQILPNQRFLDLFTAQDNTLCISIWSARAEKGEWTTFFFFFWLEALGRLEMYCFSSLRAHQHWRYTSERDALTALRGKHCGGRGGLHIHRGPPPEINHRMEVAEMTRGELSGLSCAFRGMNFKSWFIFFSLCSSLHLRFLIFSKEEGVLRRSHSRF